MGGKDQPGKGGGHPFEEGRSPAGSRSFESQGPAPPAEGEAKPSEVPVASTSYVSQAQGPLVAPAPAGFWQLGCTGRREGALGHALRAWATAPPGNSIAYVKLELDGVTITSEGPRTGTWSYELLYQGAAGGRDHVLWLYVSADEGEDPAPAEHRWKDLH